MVIYDSGEPEKGVAARSRVDATGVSGIAKDWVLCARVPESASNEETEAKEGNAQSQSEGVAMRALGAFKCEIVQAHGYVADCRLVRGRVVSIVLSFASKTELVNEHRGGVHVHDRGKQRRRGK